MPKLTLTDESLQKFINDLDHLYKENNEKRIQLIKLIQYVSKKFPYHNPSAGLLWMGLAKIANTYYFRPELENYWLFSKGSTLHSLFKKGLTIANGNNIDDCQKLINLSPLLKYVIENDLSLPGYENKNKFIEEIKALVKVILANQQNDINTLLTKRPNAKALQKNFTKLCAKYREQKSERENYLQLIEIIDSECKENNWDSALIPFNDKKLPLGYLIRFATVLYIMTQIEHTYYFRSPTNSALYRFCQNTINVNHSADVPLSERRDYFFGFRNYLPKSTTTKKFSHIKDPKTFFATIDNNLKYELSEIDSTIDTTDDPHPYAAKMTGILELALQFGIAMGFSTITGGLAQNALSRYMITSTAGFVVCAMIGAEGSLIVMQAEKLLLKLLPIAVNHTSLGRLFNQLGSSVTKTTGQIVYVTLTFPADAASALIGFSAALCKQGYGVEPYNNDEWILALLDLPSDVFSEESKERIRSVRDIVDIPMEQIEEIKEEKAESNNKLSLTS